jgi:hypothetical protein
MSHAAFATRAVAAFLMLIAAVGFPLEAQSRDSIAADSVDNRLAPITIGLRVPVRSIGSARRSLDTADVRSGARPRRSLRPLAVRGSGTGRTEAA